MDEAISMDFRARSIKDLTNCRTDLLAIGLCKGQTQGQPLLANLDEAFASALGHLLTSGDFEADPGATAVFYGGPASGPRRLAVVGLGDEKSVGLDQVRKAAVAIGNLATSLKVEHLSVGLHLVPDRLDPSDLARTIAEGICFGAYRYSEFLTGPKRRPDRLAVELVVPRPVMLEELANGMRRGQIVGRAANLARTWANRPANMLRPLDMASLAVGLAKGSRHLDCKVYDHLWLTRHKMGGILAVGSGSQNRPCLIELRYSSGKGPRRRPKIGLVGKAVTFDSGGISIKPSADMDQMKLDKTGGAVVLATMKAVDELGLDLDILGLVPAVENMPSGTSYRPGDIITTFSGKTVEIVSTDAEGRLILSDALWYAVKKGCDTLVDIATLTGACMVALGKYMAGVMGNDQALISKIQKAGGLGGEPVWPLPCGPEYEEEIKGKAADLRNTGSKWGGACTAAAFLRQFVGQARWAHIDIAGVDMLEGKGQDGPYGASGFGVRLLTRLLEDMAAQDLR